MPGVALPYANFSGTIAQMLRPFPQYSSVNDVYGNVARSMYHSLQLTLEQRRWKGLTVNVNYTFSRTEDDLTVRDAYNRDAGLCDRRERSAAHRQRDRRLRHAVRPDGQAGSENPFVRALVSGWQISGITQFRSGRPLGSILGACNLPNAGTCFADFNPDFTGDVRINGDYGDGDVLGTTPPTYIDRNAFQSAAPFTYGNTPRTMAFGLRNPSYFNQDLSIRRDFRLGRTWKLGVGADVFNVFNNVVFGGNAGGSRTTSRTRTSGVSARRRTRRASGRSRSGSSSEFRGGFDENA